MILNVSGLHATLPIKAQGGLIMKLTDSLWFTVKSLYRMMLPAYYKPPAYHKLSVLIEYLAWSNFNWSFIMQSNSPTYHFQLQWNISVYIWAGKCCLPTHTPCPPPPPPTNTHTASNKEVWLWSCTIWKKKENKNSNLTGGSLQGQVGSNTSNIICSLVYEFYRFSCNPTSLFTNKLCAFEIQIHIFFTEIHRNGWKCKLI